MKFLRSLFCGRCGRQTWLWWPRVGPEICTPCRYELSLWLKTLSGFSPRSKILVSDDRDQAKAPPTRGVSPRHVA